MTLATVSSTARDQILAQTKRMGIYRACPGVTPEYAAPFLEACVDDADPRVDIEAEGLIRVSALPLAIEWENLESADAADELVEQLDYVERSYLAAGCAGHRGRCIPLVCNEETVWLTWAPTWTGEWRGRIVTTWEPERTE